MNGSYVELNTGKIIGCEKNSLRWFHEKGHIEYNKKDSSIAKSYKSEFFFYLSVTFLIFSSLMSNSFSLLLKLSAISFITIFWYNFIYEEIWCWIYAFRKYKEVNESGRRK